MYKQILTDLGSWFGCLRSSKGISKKIEHYVMTQAFLQNIIKGDKVLTASIPSYSDIQQVNLCQHMEYNSRNDD